MSKPPHYWDSTKPHVTYAVKNAWKCPNDMITKETRTDYHECKCGCGELCRGLYKSSHSPIKG